MAESSSQPKSFGLTNPINKDSPHFQPESGRYHLYIGHGCPFAHRTYITLQLKGLADHIGVSVAHPTYQPTKPGVDDHKGWVFRSENDEPLKGPAGHGSFSCKGCIPDTANNCKTVRELYEMSGNAPTKYSVPVLWDKKNKTIVNNESAQIIRILNSSFNDFAKNPGLDLYPEAERFHIDEVNGWVQAGINMAVYRAGFAQKQEEYEEAIKDLFGALDRAEEVLSKNRYLCGDHLTETDVRAFPTLLRFDEVYHLLYKCNKKRIVDYPNLLNYCREIYQLPGIAETVNMDHIKMLYFSSDPNLNAFAIIPVGPDFVKSLQEKHNRNELKK